MKSFHSIACELAGSGDQALSSLQLEKRFISAKMNHFKWKFVSQTGSPDEILIGRKYHDSMFQLVSIGRRELWHSESEFLMIIKL